MTYARKLGVLGLLLLPGCTYEFSTSSGSGYDLKDFSVDLPSDWEVLKEVRGFVLIAQEPKQGPEDKVQENVGIRIIESLPGDLDAEKYLEDVRKTLPGNVKDYESIASGKETVNGIDAAWHTYYHTDQSIPLKALKYALWKDEKAYNITFNAARDDYAKYEETFYSIVRGFKPK